MKSSGKISSIVDEEKQKLNHSRRKITQTIIFVSPPSTIIISVFIC